MEDETFKWFTNFKMIKYNNYHGVGEDTCIKQIVLWYFKR